MKRYHKNEQAWILNFIIKDAGLISGYTGHVPISRDQFGLSYGKIVKYHTFTEKKLTLVPKVNSSMDSFNSRNSHREELRNLSKLI